MNKNKLPTKSLNLGISEIYFRTYCIVKAYAVKKSKDEPSLTSTDMLKLPNPLAKSRSPADNELTQPRLLSSDKSEPGPS